MVAPPRVRSFLTPNAPHLIQVLFDACKVVVGKCQYLDIAGLEKRNRLLLAAKVGRVGHICVSLGRGMCTSARLRVPADSVCVLDLPLSCR